MSFTAEKPPRTRTKKSKKTATSIRKRRSKKINAQRHKASCGPVAVANVIKWHGIETSYHAVLKFCEGLRAYHNRKGMWPYQMRYVLKTLRIKFTVRRQFTVEELEDLLESGGAVILIYRTKKTTSHAVFIDAKTDSKYRVWNKIRGKGPWYDKGIIKADLTRSVSTLGHLYAYIFQPLT